jgi:dipeptide/tripeptide permease
MANSDLSTSTTVKDVKQLGIWAALASLSYVFWVCGAMEMVERLAYYGVRQVSSLYATDAASNGGLGLKGSDVGIIFLFWALMQSFVPVFTGGISDRVGYKETIFASTVIKILGYLLMAWFPTFWGFMAGALVLAFGTGIFKPGIQATIVKSTSRENSSMAWGVFYQTVNIGGFIGPLLAAQLRQLEWSHVFYACAGIISINFLLLVAPDL